MESDSPAQPSPSPAHHKLCVHQRTTGRFPFSSATKSPQQGSTPVAALKEGKSGAEQQKAWRDPGRVGPQENS